MQLLSNIKVVLNPPPEYMIHLAKIKEEVLQTALIDYCDLFHSQNQVIDYLNAIEETIILNIKAGSFSGKNKMEEAFRGMWNFFLFEMHGLHLVC